MMAAEALRLARTTGIQLMIDGADLLLKASAPPQPEVLDLLARNKADIMTLLRPGRDGWSGEDWLELFDERAGIAEFDGGLPRDQAETLAFSCCIIEWLRRNPEHASPGYCDLCNQPIDTLLPYLTGYLEKDHEHTWPHQTHLTQAISALVAMGIGNSGKNRLMMIDGADSDP